MKFLKTIAGDILMLPAALEIISKIFKGVDVEDDKNLSRYAKWAIEFVTKNLM